MRRVPRPVNRPLHPDARRTRAAAATRQVLVGAALGAGCVAILARSRTARATAAAVAVAAAAASVAVDVVAPPVPPLYDDISAELNAMVARMTSEGRINR